MIKFLAIFILIFIGIVQGGNYSPDNNRVLLSDVQTLTLHRNQYTSHRRMPAVLQLKCIGGSARKSSYHPEVVQCYNRGFDGEDVQWECKADLDNAVRFGKVTVYCEGYDYPDDPYVLKGSCGLEYNLDYSPDDPRGHVKHEEDSEGSTAIVAIFIICFVGLFIYLFCIKSRNEDTLGSSRHRTGANIPPPPPPYGSAPPPYGPSAPGDAPPPYGFRSDDFPPLNKQTAGAGYDAGYEQEFRQRRQSPRFTQATAAPSDGPGFWSGLGAGGLLGYMLGSNTGRRSPSFTTTTRTNTNSGSSWFHQSNPTTAHTTHNENYGFFGSGNSETTRSGESSGMGTRTATAYGGTKRR